MLFEGGTESRYPHKILVRATDKKCYTRTFVKTVQQGQPYLDELITCSQR